MMKKVLLCLLALCLAMPAAVVAEEAAPDYTTGSPWICSNQLGVLTVDTPAELKDDFYLAVNKEDILKPKIPEGYPFAGTVMDNVLKQSADLRNLFANPKPQSHDEQLAADLYGLLMDWDTRNTLGVAPLKEKTDALEAVDSLEGITAPSPPGRACLSTAPSLPGKPARTWAA